MALTQWWSYEWWDRWKEGDWDLPTPRATGQTDPIWWHHITWPEPGSPFLGRVPPWGCDQELQGGISVAFCLKSPVSAHGFCGEVNWGTWYRSNVRSAVCGLCAFLFSVQTLVLCVCVYEDRSFMCFCGLKVSPLFFLCGITLGSCPSSDPTVCMRKTTGGLYSLPAPVLSSSPPPLLTFFYPLVLSTFLFLFLFFLHLLSHFSIPVLLLLSSLLPPALLLASLLLPFLHFYSPLTLVTSSPLLPHFSVLLSLIFYLLLFSLVLFILLFLLLSSTHLFAPCPSIFSSFSPVICLVPTILPFLFHYLFILQKDYKTITNKQTLLLLSSHCSTFTSAQGHVLVFLGNLSVSATVVDFTFTCQIVLGTFQYIRILATFSPTKLLKIRIELIIFPQVLPGNVSRALKTIYSQ